MRPKLSQVDKEALERALKMDGRKVRRGDDWWWEATSAAYGCQMDSLHLRPWQEPPCWADDDKPVDHDGTHGRAAAWALRRRLIKAGLSMYEPDPVRALEAAAARQRDRARHLAPNGAKLDTRPPARDSQDEHAPLDVVAASERERS